MELAKPRKPALEAVRGLFAVDASGRSAGPATSRSAHGDRISAADRSELALPLEELPKHFPSVVRWTGARMLLLGRWMAPAAVNLGAAKAIPSLLLGAIEKLIGKAVGLQGRSTSFEIRQSNTHADP